MWNIEVEKIRLRGKPVCLIEHPLYEAGCLAELGALTHMHMWSNLLAIPKASLSRLLKHFFC